MPVRNWWPNSVQCCWGTSWRSAVLLKTTRHTWGHWVELLKESPQALYQVLGDARRAVEVVCPLEEAV